MIDSFPRNRVAKLEPPQGMGFLMRPGRLNQCNFCQGEGHWKDQCPLLKQRRNIAPSLAPAMLCTTGREDNVVEDVTTKSGFEPFIKDAQVYLVGTVKPVNIKVLRDMGAQHSFIVQSVLPFSPGTQSGDFIVMREMELGFVSVPRRRRDVGV